MAGRFHCDIHTSHLSKREALVCFHKREMLKVPQPLLTLLVYANGKSTIETKIVSGREATITVTGDGEKCVAAKLEQGKRYLVSITEAPPSKT